MAEQAVSPMMQQYFEIKKQHPNEILFYRVGDFYEMFYDDALTASRELELTLTGKSCGKEERAPMCGVPFHSYETYVARLIAKGYKVAICEQMEDPALAKGLVKRDIIRVVTPGTVIESSMLAEDKNNYLCSIYTRRTRGRWKAGICFADISTGEAYATELNAEKIGGAIITELCRYMPSEILICPAMLDFKDVTAYIKQHTSALVELREDACFKDGVMESTMADQFGPTWRDALGYEKDALVPYAVAAMINYLHETQKHGVERIKTVQNYADAQYMRLSPVTRANLELTETMRGREKRGTLLWVLDKTRTAMGARLLRQWLEKPLVSVAQIRRRQQAVGALAGDLMTRDALERQLSGVNDMERIASRIVYGTANGRDLRALYQVCCRLPALRESLSVFSQPLLQELCSGLDTLEDIGALIDRAIVEEPPFSLREGGVIREGFDPEADELRQLLGGGTDRLAEIEARERERTGIPKLKVSYNKVFGFYIEVSKSYTGQAPADYIRKQTLTNCERYITPELKALEGEVLSASDRLTALEYQLFTGVREQIAAQIGRIQAAAQSVAAADVLCALAKAALQNHYVMPEVDDSDRIEIREGRHPVVERVLEDTLFVPNDTLLNCGTDRVYVITGPNMAGKSTFMRQTALIVLMAQCGSFVPAASANIGVCDRIFTRVGASDDLFAGRSTFMVEMNEVADILKHATSRSLLILDEIGRGTSTFDGMAIARAVLEYVADRKKLGARTLFATHYHELCELEGQLEGIKNYNIVVKKRGDDIIFIKKIVRGGANDSYGIEVAKLAGLPEEVIRRAKAVLREIESRQPAREPVCAPPEEETPQLSLDAAARQEILRRLREAAPDTMSPIEALTLLYQLHQQAVEAE